MMSVNRAVRGLLAVLAVAMLPVAAQAQFSDSYNFLKAVRDRDGEKVTKAVDEPGTTIINTRDQKTGETALHIVTARRDTVWMNFLLAKGADADVVDAQGTTPLMLATQLRFQDGIEMLLTHGARVDRQNAKGETALIRAVQLRDVAVARLLVQNGADPDKADRLAGMSARDYAIRDGRTPGLIEALNKTDVKAKAQAAGPSF